MFDESYHSYLNCLERKLFEMAKAEIDLCNRHVKYEWRIKCMQENVAVSLYYWVIGLRQVIDGERTWVETEMGRALQFIKKMIEQTGEDFLFYARLILPRIGPTIKTYLACY
jgi:hypothetical protein